MKRFEKDPEIKKSIDGIIAVLNPERILNVYAMQSVRGGEGNNGEVVFVPPPPTNNNG